MIQEMRVRRGDYDFQRGMLGNMQCSSCHDAYFKNTFLFLHSFAE